MFIRKLFSYAINPRKCLRYIENKILLSSYGKKMNDEKYLKKMFKFRLGYEIDLKNPKTFNEKMQWLKLHNRKIEYTAMVDKYLSKIIVSQQIGEEHVAKVYGVWDSFDEIDFDALPNEFVLKTTHDCGGVAVCRDKSTFNKDRARKLLSEHLRKNYFYWCREWPYKNVAPKIMAEELLKDGDREFLPVYKIMCFNGEPKVIQTIQNDKQISETVDYFDTDWNLLGFKQNFPNSEKPLPRPQNLEAMLSVAKMLSKGNPFIRIDLYTVNGNIYFSEFTFFSDAGFIPFEPCEWDLTLGSWIQLPENIKTPESQ